MIIAALGAALSLTACGPSHVAGTAYLPQSAGDAAPAQGDTLLASTRSTKPTPTPTPAPLPAEQAMAAGAVTDSIGVDTHFSYADTPYYTNYSKVSQMLIASGIKHIRDGGPGAPQWYYDRLNALAASGVRSSMEIRFGESDATIVATAAKTRPEFIEPQNEFDTSGDPNWNTDIAAFQKHAYALAKSTPSLANIPFLGPSFAQEQNASTATGNLSAYLDAGNIHDYTQCGYNPGGNGWGGYNPPYGTYGGRSYLFNVASIVSGGNPSGRPRWDTVMRRDAATFPTTASS